MMQQRLRSWLFDFAFYSLTPLYLLLLWPCIWVLPRGFTQKVFFVWVGAIVWGLRVIVGVTHHVEGLEHLDAVKRTGRPFIVASRHESAWDTFIFARYLGDFSIILKSELLWVPLFGSYLKRLGSIAVNRGKGGTQGIRQLRDQAQKAVDKNLSILIYPEGTRCDPGEIKTLQPGVALLAQQLDAYVLPVSHNAGTCWGRRALYKHAGHITLRFHAPIEPGLGRNDMLEKLGTAIRNV